VKQAWWNQVFSAAVANQLPRLKMVNWFESDKHEVEVGGDVRCSGPGPRRRCGRFAQALPRWAH
jgi:hypothetical protein